MLLTTTIPVDTVMMVVVNSCWLGLLVQAMLLQLQTFTVTLITSIRLHVDEMSPSKSTFCPHYFVLVIFMQRNQTFKLLLITYFTVV